MNTGLQDAYNLAWKLALVVKGRADPALLDTYEQERIPVAQRLLRTTDRAFQLIVSDSWLAGLFRTRILAKVAARAMTVRARADSSRSAPSRRSASAIRRARCRKPWRDCPRARRRRATASPGCGSGCERTSRPRTCSKSWTIHASICSCSGSTAPAVEALGDYGGLLRVHAIAAGSEQRCGAGPHADSAALVLSLATRRPRGALRTTPGSSPSNATCPNDCTSMSAAGKRMLQECGMAGLVMVNVE